MKFHTKFNFRLIILMIEDLPTEIYFFFKNTDFLNIEMQ